MVSYRKLPELVLVGEVGVIRSEVDPSLRLDHVQIKHVSVNNVLRVDHPVYVLKHLGSAVPDDIRW